MNYSLCVNEIFDSIDGEGKKAGQLATFIRLCGCNLRCSYCDTAYAFNEGRHMDIADIIAQVSYPNVTLTGGEPLCQDIHALLEGLKGHSVNIETNGSMDIEPYFKYDHVWFTVDYKSLSSDMANRMLPENFAAGELREAPASGRPEVRRRRRSRPAPGSGCLSAVPA